MFLGTIKCFYRFKGLGLRASRYDPTSKVQGSKAFREGFIGLVGLIGFIRSDKIEFRTSDLALCIPQSAFRNRFAVWLEPFEHLNIFNQEVKSRILRGCLMVIAPAIPNSSTSQSPGFGID